MAQQYRVLLIENNDSDAELIDLQLKKLDMKIDLEVIDSWEELLDRLQNNSPDLIISDFKMPRFNGMDALRKVREEYPRLPFILVSGYIGEEVAVDIMLEGASDYAMKDNLDRLGPSVKRELLSYEEHQRARQAIESSRSRYQTLVHSIDGIVWELDIQAGKVTYVSPQAESILGYAPEEWYASTDAWKEFVHPKDLEKVRTHYSRKIAGYDGEALEYRLVDADGEVVWVQDHVTLVKEHGRPVSLHGLIVDVTGRKRAEMQRDKAYQIADIGHWELDLINNNLYWSGTVKNLHEVSPDYEPDLESAINFYKQGEARQTIIDAVERAIETGEPFDVELQLITAKGNERWIRAVGETECHNGECLRIYGSTQNIDSRKHNEEALRKAKERYDIVAKATNDVVWDLDLQTRNIKWNPTLKTLLGYENMETGLDWWNERIHPEDRERVDKKFTCAIEEGQEYWSDEYRFKSVDGSYRDIYDRGYITFNEEGEPNRMMGSMQDITNRKQNEEKLKKLSLVASKTTDSIVMVDPEGQISWVNRGFENLTGYAFEEAVGNKPWELLRGPQTDRNIGKRLTDAFEKGESVQDIILNYKRNGEKYWVDVTADPIFDNNGKFNGFIAVEKDVTEQIEKERELQESLERYDIVSKATSDTIWEFDLQSDSVRYNSNIYNMFGYERQEVSEVGEWWRDKIHPDDRDYVLEELDNILSSKKKRFQLEYRFKASDGSYKHILDRAFVVSNGNGKPSRMIGAMQDITRQKEERKWLKLMESAIANTTECIAILSAQADESGRHPILYANDAFAKRTGYSRNEIMGNTLEMFNGPRTDKKLQERIKEAKRQWKPFQADMVRYKKDGEAFWSHVSFAPITDEDGNYSHWVAIGRDITERREHEQELAQSLKEKETLLLEIHHRVKNNLAVVAGMMQLQAFKEEDEQVREKLLNSVGRIQTMGTIHELLYNSKSFSELDFNKNMRQLVSNIASTYEGGTDIDVKYNLQPVTLNINQAIPCSLIVNEVVTNALKHAFTGREAGTLWIDIQEEEGKVIMKIRDNGVGLSNDVASDGEIDSLGMQLINTLSTQLEAEYNFRSADPGVEFSLSFAKADVKGIGNIRL